MFCKMIIVGNTIPSLGLVMNVALSCFNVH